MQVIRGIEAARFSGVVLSIGNFDGVHRGHQALLGRGAEVARAAGTRLVVMTFEPHPAAILNPDRVPPVLTPLPEKLRLLEQAGAGAVVLVESRPEFFNRTAQAFIDEIILDRFRPVAMAEGESFRFGQHRQGDMDLLRTAGRQHGFEVHAVEPARVALGGHPDMVISSSLVRHLLSSGTVDGAALCLGRPYALFGTVQRGAGRGRKLGFPTANLAVAGQLVPAEGVYGGVACFADESLTDAGPPVKEGQGERERVEVGETAEAGATDSSRARASNPQSAIQNPKSVEGEPSASNALRAREIQNPKSKIQNEEVSAAISIGRTPTFDGHEMLVEAYLLDFAGDLYGRAMRLEFRDWIRGQQKFASADDLIRQMRADVQRVRDRG